MSSTANPRRILPGEDSALLHAAPVSRDIEAAALSRHAPHALMQRAGTAVARLALAIAPHARRIWVACGPGNNGGDGLVAARHLHRAGLSVQATLVGDARRLPADASRALADAVGDGVPISDAMPATPADLVIDALLGLGASRAPQGALADAIAAVQARQAPVLAVDLPSGLHADTGQPLGASAVAASHTLALLTLKPGLFTGSGRDHAGQVWLDTLGVPVDEAGATATLSGADSMSALAPRTHASHKGNHGDLVVIAGAAGMTGAALLAARAGLAGGAGRVFVSLLDPAMPPGDTLHPELMFRPQWWRGDPATLGRSTVVCGCGGGTAVHEALPPLLSRCARLLLDADALNAIAADEGLRRMLRARGARGQATVLTPHPLEAARLLGCNAAQVQADRLRAADTLMRELACVVLLKGSGSVLAAPGRLPAVNSSGNGLLAAAGSGDVLAGWGGGFWAQLSAARGDAESAWLAMRAAAWLHGHAADRQLARSAHALALRAGELIEHMREAAAARR